jgi:hypothetical protein
MLIIIIYELWISETDFLLSQPVLTPVFVGFLCVNTKSLQDRELKQAMTTRTPAKTGSENR